MSTGALILRLPGRAIRDADVVIASPGSSSMEIALAASVLALALERGEPLVPGATKILARLLFDSQLDHRARLRLAGVLAHVEDLDVTVRALLALRSTRASRRDVEVACIVLAGGPHLCLVGVPDVRRLQIHVLHHRLAHGPVVELLEVLGVESRSGGGR